VKINKDTLNVEVEGEYEDVTDLEDWAAEYLPDNQPRFLVWSYVFLLSVFFHDAHCQNENYFN
jgi:hypothetical protein